MISLPQFLLNNLQYSVHFLVNQPICNNQPDKQNIIILKTGADESTNNPKVQQTADNNQIPMSAKQLNPKSKEIIANQQKIKQLGLKKSLRSFKKPEVSKILKQNQTLKKGLQKSQTLQTKNDLKLTTPKNKANRNTQSVNIERSETKIQKKQLSPQEKQLNLFEKKKNLEKQLEKVCVQIKQFSHQKSKKSHIKKQSQPPEQNEQQVFKRVNNFLRKMKKQKQELILKKKKSQQKQLNTKVQKQAEIYESLMAEQEILKKERKKFLQQKMQERKAMAELRNKLNKRSNSLIQELIGQRNSDRKDNTQRIRSQISEEKFTEVQSSSHFLKRKKYEISPFLSQVFKEEELKKKERELKIMERKRVYLKQKQYAEKTRAKTKMSTYETIEIF